jgi:putative oxidoreductase
VTGTLRQRHDAEREVAMNSTALSGQSFAALRIVTGLLFLAHGVQKYFGFPIVAPFGIVQPASLLGVTGILELVGGAMIVVGLFTRPVAFVLSGMMAVGYFMIHMPKSLFPIANGGEMAVMFCFVFLYISTVGAGRWSIDASRATRR